MWNLFKHDPEASALLGLVILSVLFCAWSIRRWWTQQRRLRP